MVRETQNGTAPKRSTVVRTNEERPNNNNVNYIRAVLNNLLGIRSSTAYAGWLTNHMANANRSNWVNERVIQRVQTGGKTQNEHNKRARMSNRPPVRRKQWRQRVGSNRAARQAVPGQNARQRTGSNVPPPAASAPSGSKSPFGTSAREWAVPTATRHRNAKRIAGNGKPPRAEEGECTNARTKQRNRENDNATNRGKRGTRNKRNAWGGQKP